MTESPADLIEVQHYVQGQTGLPWDALGIKHATPQGGGYHEGNDLLAAAGRLTTDYSKRESSRDRPGTNSASAFDLGGEFPDFRSITLGIVFACQRADPRTRDIREVIYTPDGVTVRRWDRLGVRSSGDTSHLSHTHTSFFRDSEGRRNRSDNFLGLLRELFEGAVPTSTTGDEMPNGELPAGFAINETDGWMDDGQAKAVAVPLPAVGPRSGGGWGPAWLYLAGTDTATVRFGCFGQGVAEWHDATVRLTGTAGPLALPNGTTQLLLTRKRTAADDAADSVPVRWHVQYDG